MSKDNFQLRFGALAPRIRKQLEDQGVSLDFPPDTITWQGWADSVTQLFIAGILTEAEVHRARRRIVKVITKELRETHGK